MASHDQELLPEQTEGFKVGQKRTIDEYHKMGTFSTFPFVTWPLLLGHIMDKVSMP